MIKNLLHAIPPARCSAAARPGGKGGGAWWVACLGMTLLAACGGGGGGSSSGSALASSRVTVTFSGKVLDGASGDQPLQGATVTLATSAGAQTGTTDASGTYAITVDASMLPTNTSTLLTIVHDSHDTHVQSYASSFTSGATYGVTPDGSAPTPSTGGALTQVTLRPLAPGEFSPAEGAQLVHLGDGIFPGTAENSRFQAPASAIRKSVRLGSLDGLDLSQYTALTLSITLRGLETSTCADQLRFFQSTSSDGATARSGVQVLAMVNSPPDGSLGTQSFSPVISALDASLGSLWVELESGACGGSDAADDFEFLDVRASFS